MGGGGGGGSNEPPHCPRSAFLLSARMRAARVTVVVSCVCVCVCVCVFVCVCVYVCVSVRSFLPPRASRPRNIGTYVFIATRKILL